MRWRRYTEEQIIRVLRQVEADQRVEDVIQEHGISEETYCRSKPSTEGWRSLTLDA